MREQMNAVGRLLVVGCSLVLLTAPALGNDPDLEPGFPVQAYLGGGTYHSGPAVHTLVANIDGDPELEIVVTSLAAGPLNAWNYDGTIVSGWPVSGYAGAAYMAAGNLTPRSETLSVFSAFFHGDLAALSANGAAMSGWPLDASNFCSSPPALADIDGDGMDEIFLGEEDWNLHGYAADGTELPGWPVGGNGGQEEHTPAIADLDGDGDLEIVSASGWTSPGVYLHAFHHDGTSVSGFPILFDNGHVDTYPVIGDVDGNGDPEIVVVMRQDGYPWHCTINVLTADGNMQTTITLSDRVSYGTAPVLADLDGDGVPEILAQLDGRLEAYHGDGTVVAGFPVTWSGNHRLGNSAPVVGDVDGDQLPEIVMTSQVVGSAENGQVVAYNHDGTPLAGFPKSLLIGSGAVPAIADIDLDGRNEIVVSGSYTNLVAGYYDKVWVYDLGGEDHGRIEWGQFGGGPRHQGVYVAAPGCVGDLDGNNLVNLADLQILLSSYGVDDGADLDGDGDTDLADLQILLAHYGDVC